MVAWLSADLGVLPSTFARNVSIVEFHKMAAAKYLSVYAPFLIVGEMLTGGKSKRGDPNDPKVRAENFRRMVERQRRARGRTGTASVYDVATPEGEAVLLGGIPDALPLLEDVGKKPARPIDRMKKRMVKQF